MIAPMDQVLVVGRRTIAKDVLVSLQSLGVVQVERLEPEEGSELARLRLEAADQHQKELWDFLVSKTSALLDALAVGEDVRPGGRGEIPSDPEALQGQLAPIAQQVERLVAERGDIRDELEVTGSYLPLFRHIAPALAQLEGSRFLAGIAFMVPDDEFADASAALDEALEGRVALAPRLYQGERLVVAAVLRRDVEAFRAALSKAGLSELALPDRYADEGVAKAAHVMEERSQSLPKRLAVIDEELGKLAAQHGPRLRAAALVAGNHQVRYQRLEDLAAGRYGFALRGWVPSDERARVVDALRKQFGDDLVVDTRPADEHHDEGVPVKLENRAWVKPFEGLLALFAPPKYGSFDPSWTLAVFFPMYFGLVVGDIGFGLLFAAIAWWLRRRGASGRSLGLGPLGITIRAPALKPITTVIYWCAAWSVVFGFLYGEFFGNLLERFPAGRPVFYSTLHEPVGHGLIDIVLFRVEVFTPLLLLSIGFGVLQVLGGWVIRVIYGVRHRDRKHVFEGVGMVSGLAAVVLFATAYLSGGVSPAVLVVSGLGLALFLVCVVLAGMPLMIVEIISNSGNILSYLRLFAVGLSAALVANLATDLGYAIGGTLPILGPILGIAIGLAVHLIAIALTIIGHTLQPLRLQYVEFFTKFGFYDENGRPYQPFRLLGGK